MFFDNNVIIPEIIKVEAQKHGCNSIEFCGVLDGSEVFGVGVVDKDGNALPTGLPKFLLLKGTKVEFIFGEAALDLCSRL